MRRATSGRIDELGRMHVLRHCDRRELKVLAGVVHERSLEAGETLCHLGDPSDEVYFVRAGQLLVRVDDQVVATLAAGALAGELGPLAGSVRSADLVALGAVSLFAAPAATLRRSLSECQGLRRAVTPLLAERAEQNDRRVTT